MLEYLNVFMLQPQARRVFQICDGDERCAALQGRTVHASMLTIPSPCAVESWTNHIRCPAPPPPLPDASLPPPGFP